MKTLLIIGHVWPEPKSSAAGSRMLQLIDLFQEAKYQITFATACAKGEHAFDLSQLNIDTVQVELNHSSFDNFIKELGPDVVLFDRFMTEEQFGWRVAEHCPNALRLLDTEDLHGLRKGRGQALKDGNPFERSYLLNTTTKRELASIYRSDLSIIISEAEMKLLKNDFKVDSQLVYYLPFLLDEIPKTEIAELPNYDAREHFITIGNFVHEPNYDAVVYLKEVIWPKVRRRMQEAELHIYGSYESQKVRQLHNPEEGFLIKGFVDDVNRVMQNARVCLAPLRFGAGLKGKLIDAMKNGTPCVMTSTAAEGMFGAIEPNGFVEDESEAFVDFAEQLYCNGILWNEKQQKGFEVLHRRFQKDDFREGFRTTLNAAINELHNNRHNNFIGQMLMLQTTQSSKFMSKWIEEKNKN